MLDLENVAAIKKTNENQCVHALCVAWTVYNYLQNYKKKIIHTQVTKHRMYLNLVEETLYIISRHILIYCFVS